MPRRPVTEAWLLQLLDEQHQAIQAAVERGDDEAAAEYLRRAGRVERLIEAVREEAARQGLPLEQLNAKVRGMTDAQKAARAQAISRARAGKDRFLLAVSKSGWKSLNRYARERLDISPGMLTGYKNGDYDVPEAINAKVEEDFGMRLPVKRRAK